MIVLCLKQWFNNRLILIFLFPSKNFELLSIHAVIKIFQFDNDITTETLTINRIPKSSASKTSKFLYMSIENFN